MRIRLITLLGVLLVGNPCLSQPPPLSKQAPDSQALPVANEPLPGTTVFTAPPTTRIWGSADYLLWWVKAQNLPPLATTSAPGTPITNAGVLGLPSTAVLFGGAQGQENPRSGGRFTLGYWLDDYRDAGLGTSFFMLGNRQDQFTAQSPGDRILARPIFDVTFPGQAAQITAFPGIAKGSIDIFTSTELLGADLFLLRTVYFTAGSTESFRVNGLVGYRFLQLRDSLAIQESLTSIGKSPQAPPFGTTFALADNFQTQNQFHGGDLGVQFQFTGGRFSFDVLTRMAFGATQRVTTINGNTQITQPGLAPINLSGGLLALDTNSGRFSDHVFSVVPEVRLSMGYQVTSRLRASLGYEFLYWNNVVRSGDQVDLRVNPNHLPPVIGGDPKNPAVLNQSSSFWAQGINFGVHFNY